MIPKLRKRFIRIAMLAVTSVLLLLCLIVNAASLISTNRDLNEMLTAIQNNQGTLPAMPPEGKPDGQRPPEHFTPETPYSTRYFVLRYDDSGTLTRADLEHIAAVTEDDTARFLTRAVGHGAGTGYYSGYKFTVQRTGENRWMAIFLDCSKELRTVGMTAVLTVASAAICVALVYGIVVLCSRRAIDPVVRASEQQKQFITDAGHELKTPITVITTDLKLLEMEVGQQKWIDMAREQTEKLKELVNALVTLSRMDEDASPLRHAPFSASEAVGETAESFRAFAEERGHTLRLAIAPDVTYTGDEYAVRQLVSILLDNAVKYASEGTPIDFSMERRRKGLVLTCRNDCAPIPPEKLQRLFDRFYRADPSRSAGTGGFGLGLSVARSIAEGHHGSARAHCPTEHSVEFVLELR